MRILVITSKTHGTHEVYYDDEDEDLVSKYTWSLQAVPKSDILYVVSTIFDGDKKKRYFLHRLILGLQERTVFVDHKNHNGLDNRKENLRPSTNRLNQGNRRSNKTTKTSQYKGVYFRAERASYARPWVASIRLNGKKKCLGYFSSESEAFTAYCAAATKEFGGYVYLEGESRCS